MSIKATLSRNLKRTMVAAAVGLAVVTATPSPAQAEQYNGYCSTGEFCLWWLSNQQGPIADFYYDRSNYAGWYFWNSTALLNNNTMSSRNNSYWIYSDMCVDANYGGGCLVSQTRQVRNSFDSFFVNKASSHFFG